MIFSLIFLIFVITLASMASAYKRTRDPLHPMMFFGPMFLYVFAARPVTLSLTGQLAEFIPDETTLLATQGLFTAGIICFCIGNLKHTKTNYSRLQHSKVRFRSSEGVRRRMFQLGCFLGTLSIAAYLLGLSSSGGFLKVYSHAKGHYSAGSGWINELVNLSIPAAALMLLSWQGIRRYRHHVPLALLFASPLLIHGFLGARRGPTFIVLATFFVSWYVISKKRVSIWKIVTRLGAIGVVVFALVSHRSQIYIGSDFNFNFDNVIQRMAPVEVDTDDDLIFPYGLVTASMHTGKHYWGLRYAATYFVRPIPRQLWPTKYDDMGLGWMVRQEDVGGISEAEWLEAVGWNPVRGSAAGFIADLFLEFSWGALFFCYLLGMFYGWLWRKAATLGGVWTLLFIQAAALSIYVPTQSVSAVFHRFLFMSLPTILIWKLYVDPHRQQSLNPRMHTSRLTLRQQGLQ